MHSDQIEGLGHELFAPEALVAFVEDVLMVGGSSLREARQVANHLVDSDRAGHPSHGVGLIPMYVDHRLRDEVCPNASTSLVSDNGQIATFDGNGGYGRPAGEIAMEAALVRARHTGLAAVALRNAHHLGRIGAFGEMIAAEGLIAIQFVSVQRLAPMVAPHGGIEARLSTNPICITVPRRGAEPILLDISTSAIANNKVRVAAAEGLSLPARSIIDYRGQPTTDAGAMMSEPRGAILPVGGHKG
jgi:hydroxycarboxylate dehydrogenase B